MISSVRPSLKYSSGSGLRFENGRTAMAGSVEISTPGDATLG
jgi:hypothetical protein